MPPAWQFGALGAARLLGPHACSLELERKAAAVLTLLALEGPQPRSRIAGLLWPESRELTARNNLTQLLRKLRLTTGDELVFSSPSGMLSLTDRVQVDASEAREAYDLGRLQAFLSTTGDLLAGHEYDDCPEFEEWLLAERDRWTDRRRKALVSLADDAERRGDLEAAVIHAELLLETDVVSEDAHARLMRLHYLQGDRLRALDLYQRLEGLLRREFHVEPLESTRALARTIQQGITVPGGAPRARSNLPLGVLRPPVLAGREREWELMEDAWTNGKGIILSGEPGVGKTRLMTDFARSKGRWVQFEARPGDQAVPYSTFARSWRRILKSFPDLDIPEWVRREFSRLVPEVWTGEPPPLNSPADRVRFFDATAEMARLISRDIQLVLADDMQYYDSASNELSLHVAVTFAPFTSEEGAALPVVAFRRGELSRDLELHMRGLVEAGLHAWVDVTSLDSGAVQVLIDGLDLPGATRHAQRLASFSGGNPLYLLETLKHLVETDQLGSDMLDDLPVPERAAALIGERFMRLSTTARHVAQTAAVLQSNFTVELVARILHAPLLDCVAAWQELEDAHILDGERFSHDLVYESVRQSMTSSTMQALHRGAARALEEDGASPMRVAQHWVAGDAPSRAAPALLRAGRAAEDALLLIEADRYYQRAVELYRQMGDDEGLFEALGAFVMFAVRVRPLDQLASLIAELERHARHPAQHAAVREAARLAAARQC